MLKIILKIFAVFSMSAFIACTRPTIHKEVYEQRAYEAGFNSGYQEELQYDMVSEQSAVFAMDESPAPRGKSAMGSKRKPSKVSSNILPQAPRVVTANEVHYNGAIHSRQAEPNAFMDSISSQVEKMGGQVEYRHRQSLVLKVPVNHFLALYEKLMGIGEITYHRLWAENLSHQIKENALRERLAQETLAKLKELIAKAKDEKEKLRLLKELQRVMREIESLKMRATTLADLVAFSKLELSVLPLGQIQDQGAGVTGPFQWVRNMNPLEKHSLYGEYLEFSEEPKGFVLVKSDDEKIYTAAGGSEAWIVERENNPRGDKEFWNKVIDQHLGAQYQNVSKMEWSGISFFRMESRSNNPYVYYVGFEVNKEDSKELKIYQLLFPNKTSEEKHVKSLRQAVEAL